MHVKQVMSRPVQTIAADASVYDAAEMLLNAGISAAPVVDPDGRLVGIVSEADLMYRSELGTTPGKSWLQRLMADDAILAADYVRAHAHRVADVMTRNVVTVEEQTPLRDVATLMQRHRIKRIPVVRDGKVVGIVGRANLLQGLLARQAASPGNVAVDEALRDAVAAELARHSWATRQPTCIVAENGVVHLWGFVDSAAVRDACRVAAENVRGVRSVVNHISVLPPEAHLGV